MKEDYRENSFNPNNIKAIGICSKSVSWMYSEGFFEKNPEFACSTWISNAEIEVLEALHNFYLDMLKEIFNESHIDPIYAALLVEAIKSGDFKKPTFTEEQISEFVVMYCMSAGLEMERRKGNIEVRSFEVPLKKTKWRDAKFHGKDWEKPEKSV